MKKKLLSQILIVAMAFTMTAMPVYADENIPQDETILTEAVTEETEETAVQETLTADPAEIYDAQAEAEDIQDDGNDISDGEEVQQTETVQIELGKNADPIISGPAANTQTKSVPSAASVKAEPADASESEIDTVRKAIQALDIDPSSYTAGDRERVEEIYNKFNALGSEDRAALDAETSHPNTSQPLGRVLESALWSVWSYDAVDDSTALANGTYDAASAPALSSVYSKGKSTSSRQKAWSVKSVTVENGHATATIAVESSTYSGIWIGGKTYPRTNTSGNCEFSGVPIDLNSTFYFAGISTSMPVPIAFSLTTTIDESASESVEADADYTAVDEAIAAVPADLSVYTDESAKAVTDAVNAVVRGKKASEQAAVDAMAKAVKDAVNALVLRDLEDGELTVTNNTGMFKVVKAYITTENDRQYLFVTMSGSSYHEMFLGTYEEAAANGNNRNNWVHGYKNADGKWEFKIPVTAQDTYIPIVAISQTYLDSYDAGQNSLERAFYPRQFELNSTARTLVTGDYKHSQTLTIENNIKMFKPSAAAIDTVGGPNSNNYSSDLILTMGSDAYDKMYVGTYQDAEKAQDLITLADGNVFTVPVRWVETFGQPETMKTLIGETFKASFHSKSKDLWYEREITISEKDGTIVFDDVTADYSAVEAAKKKVPADLSIYTDETAKAVTDAVEDAKAGKNIAEQEAVDAMAKAIEDAVDALELRPEEAGNADLTITNNTAMFKAVSASLVSEDGQYYLVMALSGKGYRELFKGTYEEAAANGNNRDNWIHGYQNADGKWEFKIPVTAGETYVPCVAISQTYVDNYDAGKNPLERAFFPRQFTIDRKAKTLVTDDYNETAAFKVTSKVADFKVSATANTTVVGGPNSNNYSVSPVLEMLNKTYDEVIYPTVVNGEVSTAKAAIKDGNFEISMTNAPGLEAFKDKTPVEMTFHVASDSDYKAAGKYVVRTVTIDKMAKTIVIEGTPLEKKGSDKKDDTVDPVVPDPSKKDDQKGKGGSGDSGYAPAVDSSTTLKDGTYTPDSFSWSGGTGKLSISCTSVEVRNGQAYATIVFTSTKVDQLKASGGLYYKQGGGNSTFIIPVNLNANNTIVARTTAMSQPHWIEYTIYVGLGEGEGQAEKAKEAKKAAAEAKVKMSEEAPTIVGLDAKDAKSTVEYSKYFKIFEYDHGVKMLSIDITDKTELKEEYTKNAEEAVKASESEEEVQYDEEGKVIAKAKTEYIEELYKNNVVNYLLVPEDYEVPAGLDKEYIIITVPAEKTFMASQEVIAMMEELGCLDAVSLLGMDEKDVKNDTLKKALKDEKIKLAGNLEKPEYAKVVKDKSDLAVLPGDLLPEEIDKKAKDKEKEELAEKAKEKKEALEKLESRFTALEVPVVIDRSAQEEDELAQAEWIKVYGALFGCDEEAAKIFEKKVKEAEKNEKN